jgi:hypothetical protein
VLMQSISSIGFVIHAFKFLVDLKSDMLGISGIGFVIWKSTRVLYLGTCFNYIVFYIELYVFGRFFRKEMSIVFVQS